MEWPGGDGVGMDDGSLAVTLDDVRAAAARIARYVWRTPLVESLALTRRTGGVVALKCETWQRTRSFKVRGAFSRLTLLDAAERARGVVAASAGNHALGVALAARTLGVTATVVVPEAAPAAKAEAAWALGAEVVRRGGGYDAAEAYARELAAERGAVFVHPFSDPAVVAGQGTVGLELAADWPECDQVVVPVGGGGLACGIAAALLGLAGEGATPKRARVVGVQSDASPAMAAAFRAGRVVPVPVGPTLADGLAGQIDAASFELARRLLDDMVTVPEAAIAEAMAWCVTEERIVAEGAAAAAVAALLTGAVDAGGRRTAVVLSGANVDGPVLRGVLTNSLPQAD